MKLLIIINLSFNPDNKYRGLMFYNNMSDIEKKNKNTMIKFN